MVKKKEKQICWSCIEDFDDKELYWVKREKFQVLHCLNCLEKNGVEKYTPYCKPRKKKETPEVIDKIEKKVFKKKIIKK